MRPVSLIDKGLSAPTYNALMLAPAVLRGARQTFNAYIEQKDPDRAQRSLEEWRDAMHAFEECLTEFVELLLKGRIPH